MQIPAIRLLMCFLSALANVGGMYGIDSNR